MSEVKLDAKVFHRRARSFLSFWKKQKDDPTLFSGVQSILVVVGQSDEDNPYQKSTSLHSWLFGYEFPGMVMLLTLDKIYFSTSIAKAKHLETLTGKDGGVPLEIFKRTKDEEVNRKAFTDITDAMKAAGDKVGILAKDKFQGKFMTEWEDVYKLVKGDFEEIDVSPGIAMAMSVKDDEEQKSIKAASQTSLALLTKYFEDEMGDIIENEKRVSHSKLAERIESKLDDQKFLKSQKLGADFDPDQLEWAYTPIIQSGGVYDLRPSAQSDDSNLHGGVVVCSLGVRYKSYCSNVGRTYLFDPNSTQEKYYNFLVSLQKKVFESIKAGAVIKDIYGHAVGQIRAKFPELESHFVKNMGSAIGIEFRDSTTLLNAKNTRVLKAGMALNVSIGFQNLDNPEGKNSKESKYSLLLVDTVLVTNDAPVVPTDSQKELKHISFFIKDEESEEEKPAPKRSEKRGEAKSTSVFTRDRTRGQGKDVDDSDEVRRREHQKELHVQKQEEGLARFKDQGDGDANGTNGPQIKKFESYKRPNQLPSSVDELKVVVDSRNQTVIVPIYGVPVPFHISTLRNASKNDEGDYVYLRLNFMTPGQGIAKADTLPFEDSNANFVRSLTFRSADAGRMSDIFRNIQDLKKNAVKREAERKEMEDVVEQENLREIRNRRPQRLLDLFARPTADNKRVPGELEIHENGLRYQTAVRSDSRIDLLFNNIRHVFFQPNDSELVTIIHVHLKNPIMVGKRKTKDVQFYREVTDAAVDETGNRKRKYRYGDDDEHEQEAEERRRRAAMNKEFKEFAQKIADASNGEIQVDIPFRNLGFNGVPFRSNVLLQPSTECLVNLTETPFLVVTLADIEIVHLERVQFGLKNFDMVMIFKDFHRPPVHINSIPMEHLDNVKSWLDSCDIAFSEGPLNLNWTTIMKTVNEDPAQFFKDGGWKFLEVESDDESDQSESASEFEMSEEEFEEESEEDESDFDDDASDDDGSDADEDESGEDWSEMEEEAARKDKRKANGQDGRDPKRRK